LGFDLLDCEVECYFLFCNFFLSHLSSANPSTAFGFEKGFFKISTVFSTIFPSEIFFLLETPLLQSEDVFF